jgi:ribulose 1,5-bisphosphate carboxylase large subunit-like protein
MAKETKTRLVIVTAENLLEMFKDYLTSDVVPADAKVVKIMIHPKDRKLAIVASSGSWTGQQPAVVTDFSLKRVYSVGGSNA